MTGNTPETREDAPGTPNTPRVGASATEDSVEVEWAIDYRDGCGPRPADEWQARRWVTYWNERRRHPDRVAPAVLLCRTVTATPWRKADQ